MDKPTQTLGRKKSDIYKYVFSAALLLLLGGTVAYLVYIKQPPNKTPEAETTTQNTHNSVSTNNSNPTILSTTFSSDGSKKTVVTTDFTVTIPSEWQMETGNFVSTKNRAYRLTFAVGNIDQMGSEDQRSLLKSHDILGYEASYFANLCKESDSCGKITSSRNLNFADGVGFEFIVTYPGLSVEEHRGSINEIHQSFIKGNKYYAFWASGQQIPPPELLSKYPPLNPTQITQFKEIMQTLSIK